MNKKYKITIITKDETLEFSIRAKSQIAALDILEKEWGAKNGKGDFDKQTVGIHG